jgi:hypothetical protein
VKRRVDKLTVDSINGAMQANERGFLRSSSIRQETAANGTFTVMHDLGSVPDEFSYTGWGDVRVWATESNRNTWTTTSATLTGNAAETISVWFLKRLN